MRMTPIPLTSDLRPLLADRFKYFNINICSQLRNLLFVCVCGSKKQVVIAK